MLKHSWRNTISIFLHYLKWRPPFLEIFFVLAALAIGIILALAHDLLILPGLAAFIALGILRGEIFLFAVLGSRPIADQFVEVAILRFGETSINLQAVLGISIISVCLSHFVLHGRKNAGWEMGLSFPIFLFLGEASFAIFSSYDLMVGLGDWIRMASWMLLIPFCASVLSDQQKRKRIIASCVIAGISCIILSGVGPIGDVYGLGERKGWFFSLHNAALLMIGIFPFILIKFIRAKGKWRALYSIIAMLLLTAIFFTFVRSAWIGILIQILSVFILVRRERKLRLLLFLLLGLFVSAAYVSVYSLDLEKRVADLTYENTPFYYRHMGSGRIGFWEDILIAFWDAPLEGKLVGQGFRSSIFATEIGVGAHNDFIDILSNNGMFGLGLMLWIIVSLFKIGRRLLENAQDEDMACVYWGVFWTFMSVSFINGIMFYVGTMWYISTFIGLTFAIIRFDNHKRSDK